jgi:hypothetical protein
MTPSDLATLRAACESALARAEGKTSQPVVPLLPAGMVLGLVEAAEELERIRAKALGELAALDGAEIAADLADMKLRREQHDARVEETRERIRRGGRPAGKRFTL